METSAEYSKNIKNRIITTSMLEDALFSVNKRAKNYRNAKRKASKPAYYFSAQEKMNNFYGKKDILLSIVKPIRVHREIVEYAHEHIDYKEPHFREKFFEMEKKGLIEDSLGTSFYIDLEKSRINYYLYYCIGEHTFHTPISKKEALENGLEIITIDNLLTEGHDVDSLVSVQFVDKLIELVGSGSYTFVKDKEDNPPVFRNASQNRKMRFNLLFRECFVNYYRATLREKLDLSLVDQVTFSREEKIKKGRKRIKFKIKPKERKLKLLPKQEQYLKTVINEESTFEEFEKEVLSLVPSIKEKAQEEKNAKYLAKRLEKIAVANPEKVYTLEDAVKILREKGENK